MKCRMDWHQTGTHVIISVYAKKYNPALSYVKLNPIHLTVELYFPEENSKYNFDTELRGVSVKLKLLLILNFENPTIFKSAM